MTLAERNELRAILTLLTFVRDRLSAPGGILRGRCDRAIAALEKMLAPKTGVFR